MGKRIKNMEQWNKLTKEEQEQYLQDNPMFAKKLKVATQWYELTEDWIREVEEVWE